MGLWHHVGATMEITPGKNKISEVTCWELIRCKQEHNMITEPK